MINFTGINANSGFGRILRSLLKLIPKGYVLPILQGPVRGMKWIVGSSDHGCWLGSYELKKQEQILKYLKPGMVVYDIGAHVGFYTLLFARGVGPSGRVYAFEPFPDNYLLLQKHHSLNKLYNVITEQVAVADTNGEALLYYDNKSSYTGNITKYKINEDFKIIKVKTITLDDYVNNNNKNASPDLLKMDIEGAEYLALNGMKNTINKGSPILFIALHGDSGSTAML